MSTKTLKDLMIHALKDIYYAENAILKALPKMIDGARNAELKKGLTEHRKETEGHVKRIEKIFGLLDLKPESVPCEAIKGILKEGEEVLEKFGGSPAGDAGVIFSCQAVEHYEINRYGSMHAWAEELGLDDVADILAETLEEEYAADDKLTEIAESAANLPVEKKTKKTAQRAAKAARTSETKKSKAR